MARKARQTVSYVLEGTKAAGGHKMGVQTVAVDRDNAILYSGGRDGIICAWDLNLPLAHKSSVGDAADDHLPATTHRAQTHSHTNWVSSIVLTHDHQALVSASQDFSVNLWRPRSATASPAQPDVVTLGQHKDYAKCVCVPPADAPGAGSWVASGGLDRKIHLWDLAGGGSALEIDTRGEEIPEKGSVYALAAGRNVLANGGPEKIVRLWDTRTGAGITKFVGHTDMIRAVLLDDTGDAVMSASSDQTIKIWSIKSGRCMHTFSMHGASVWALYSEDPQLRLFYSADRSGLIAKTDVRGAGDYDEGVSVAVACESRSVWNMAACAGHIWPATANSSINRWADVDTTEAAYALPARARPHQRTSSSATYRAGTASLSKIAAAAAAAAAGSFSSATPGRRNTLAGSLLRLSNTSIAGNLAGEATAVRQVPDHTIEGHYGLLKCRLLKNRRHVLTSDTAGSVDMWDIIRCCHVGSHGKKHPLERVVQALDTIDPTPSWCTVDASSGSLTVTLDPLHCFDAEVYADELGLDVESFREDQRINLGKWVLRYLFADLIDEEVRRDEAYRQKLAEDREKRASPRPSLPAIQIPSAPPPRGRDAPDSVATTPRAGGAAYTPMTPSMIIGLATPATATLPNIAEGMATSANPLDGSKRVSDASRPSTTEREDYFGSSTTAVVLDTSSRAGTTRSRTTETSEATDPEERRSSTDGNGSRDAKSDGEAKDDAEKDRDAQKTPTTPFGKMVFRNPFGSKKRSASTAAAAPAAPAAAAAGTDTAAASAEEEKIEAAGPREPELEANAKTRHSTPKIHENFYGVIQRIRREYDRLTADHPHKPVGTRIAPSLPTDTPVLRLPPGIRILIQQERTGGMANVYQGTVGSVGQPTEVDTVERCGPTWLGELLLHNTAPQRDAVKVTFILLPYPGSGLSTIQGPGGTPAADSKLNANRLLRVKKILAYVAERIGAPPAMARARQPEKDRESGRGEGRAEDNEKEPGPAVADNFSEEGKEGGEKGSERPRMKPEEFLEIYCSGKVISPNTTLGALKAHVWKGPGEMVLHYKAIGGDPEAAEETDADGDAAVGTAVTTEGNERVEQGGDTATESGGADTD